MKIVTLIARIIFGLIFVVFGLNGFFTFMPQPQLPDEAGAFLAGLAGSGYFFPVLKVTEITSGLLILSGKLLPLGLVLIAPIVVQILLFHVFLAPEGIAMAAFLFVVNIFLAYSYRNNFKSVLEFSSSPG